MVEMTETARILNRATARSLVILDEIGRGTSTYDGISLAWAVVEHLHQTVHARTLFATHYHELTDLGDHGDGIANLNVAVREYNGDIAFLHKIVPGAADKSYGIHVAKLAGVPTSVINRANEILLELENEDSPEQSAQIKTKHRPSKTNRLQTADGMVQLTFFDPVDNPVLTELSHVDINTLTPLDALALIQKWQKEI